MIPDVPTHRMIPTSEPPVVIISETCKHLRRMVEMEWPQILCAADEAPSQNRGKSVGDLGESSKKHVNEKSNPT